MPPCQLTCVSSNMFVIVEKTADCTPQPPCNSRLTANCYWLWDPTLDRLEQTAVLQFFKFQDLGEFPWNVIILLFRCGFERFTDWISLFLEFTYFLNWSENDFSISRRRKSGFPGSLLISRLKHKYKNIKNKKIKNTEYKNTQINKYINTQTYNNDIKT